MTLARKHSKCNVSQQFVEMFVEFRTSHGSLDIKKIRAMSFLPSVKCGKFKLKKAFQRGKILACTVLKNLKSAPLLFLS